MTYTHLRFVDEKSIFFRREHWTCFCLLENSSIMTCIAKEGKHSTHSSANKVWQGWAIWSSKKCSYCLHAFKNMRERIRLSTCQMYTLRSRMSMFEIQKQLYSILNIEKRSFSILLWARRQLASRWTSRFHLTTSSVEMIAWREIQSASFLNIRCIEFTIDRDCGKINVIRQTRHDQFCFDNSADHEIDLYCLRLTDHSLTNRSDSELW